MGRMDTHSRNEYLKLARESYFKCKTKKGKSEILDEYCCNTGPPRRYVIRKIHGVNLEPKQRKKRRETYDGQVKAALAKVWRATSIEWNFFLKFKKSSSATIDRKLKHQRVV
jgi:hypothetical protein